MPAASPPTAVTTPVRQSASADAGMISPRFVSDSSSEGWMTTWSSSGSSVRSTWRKLQPAGFDDPLKELLRPRLARRAEDLLRRSLLEDHTAARKAHAVGAGAREESGKASGRRKVENSGG